MIMFNFCDITFYRCLPPWKLHRKCSQLCECRKVENGLQFFMLCLGSVIKFWGDACGDSRTWDVWKTRSLMKNKGLPVQFVFFRCFAYIFNLWPNSSSKSPLPSPFYYFSSKRFYYFSSDFLFMQSLSPDEKKTSVEASRAPCADGVSAGWLDHLLVLRFIICILSS